MLLDNVSDVSFKPFVKRPKPELGVFEVLVGPTYEAFGDEVREVWSSRPMTEEERAEKISLASSGQPYPSWSFNQETCSWIPPVEIPDQNSLYRWDESKLIWIDVSAEEKASEIRRIRNNLLSGTDYLALSDNTLTPEMAAYRQALRDVTAQAGFPHSVVWPTKPQ
jgi:hypothetical protein